MLTVQERKRRVLRMFAFLLRDLLVITALVGLVATGCLRFILNQL